MTLQATDMSFAGGYLCHYRLAAVMAVEKTAACLWVAADFGLDHLHFVRAANIDVEMPRKGLTRRCQEPLEIVSAAKLLAS